MKVLEWDSPLTEGTALKGDPRWDSLGILNTMAYVEERLGVILNMHEFEHVTSVGDLMELCREGLT